MYNIFRLERPTNFKLNTRMKHGDPYHRQPTWPPRSKVKVARSRDASERCWPKKSRTKRPRNTEIGRKVAHTSNNEHHYTSFKVKGQRSRSPGRRLLRPEVCHIFLMERPTNLELETPIKNEDPYHRQAPWTSRSISQGHVMRVTRVRP